MRGLGFAPIISPSPDPVSLALDAVSGIVSVIGIFQARKDARQAQENEVVQVQNQLAAALSPLSNAAQDPNVTVDQLEQLGSSVSQLGQKFYNYTLGFQIAGPGARQTIFGDESPAGSGYFVTTAAHPGWLTQLLNSIKQKILDKSGGTVQPQMGFDWESLIGLGANVAGQIAAGVTGQPTAPIFTVTGTTPQGTLPGYSTTPSWLWPALIVVGAVLLLKNK